jgi:hypothetical protein
MLLSVMSISISVYNSPDVMQALLAPAVNTVPVGIPLSSPMITQPVATPVVMPKKLTPGSAKIQWISPTDEYLGQFFINKVYLDKEKSQWVLLEY